MTKEQIRAMLSEVIKHLDYDIWKEMFLDQYDDAEDTLKELEVVVREHIRAAKNGVE